MFIRYSIVSARDEPRTYVPRMAEKSPKVAFLICVLPRSARQRQFSSDRPTDRPARRTIERGVDRPTDRPRPLPFYTYANGRTAPERSGAIERALSTIPSSLPPFLTYEREYLLPRPPRSHPPACSQLASSCSRRGLPMPPPPLLQKLHQSKAPDPSYVQPTYRRGTVRPPVRRFVRPDRYCESSRRESDSGGGGGKL